MKPGLRTLVLLSALSVATPAFAAPKPACLLVTDASGDAVLADSGPNREALDVLSADIATGRRNLVAVVRLASFGDDLTVAAGATYEFSWSAGPVRQAVTMKRYADGTRTGSFDPNTAAQGDQREVLVTVDATTSTLTWVVPRRSNPALARKSTRFGAFDVVTSPGVHVRADGFDASFAQNGAGDTATSGKTYTDLAPSCVKGV